MVEKILYLRQQYQFGPEKIAMYLRRYYDVTVSKSGGWRILKRLDLSRLPASQRYKRHDRRWKRVTSSSGYTCLLTQVTRWSPAGVCRRCAAGHLGC